VVAGCHGSPNPYLHQHTWLPLHFSSLASLFQNVSQLEHTLSCGQSVTSVQPTHSSTSLERKHFYEFALA
jgi:hypothetical protein